MSKTSSFEREQLLESSAVPIVQTPCVSDPIVFYLLSYEVSLSQLRRVTFTLLGVALLWPWNCFLSATDYFGNRFGYDSHLASIYASTMMTISTVSSVLINLYLSPRQRNYTNRVYTGLLCNLAVFIVLSLLIFVSFENMTLLFSIIMLLVLLSSLGTAMTQNGAMAAANALGPEYCQAVMVGQAIAGVLPSLVLLFIAMVAPAKPEHTQGGSGIFMYFLTTALISAAGIVLYKFNSEYTGDITSSQTQEPETHIPFLHLFHKLKYLELGIFITFIVTLVFPVFAAVTFSSVFSNAVYIPFIFTIWNLGDLVGRLVSSYEIFEKWTPVHCFLYSVLRSGLVPLFFLCNLKDQGAIIRGDWFYVLLQFAFGFTNGHCISLCFMKVGGQLETEAEKKAAGGFSNVFVSTGLAIGSCLSYIVVFMVNRMIS